MASLNQEIEFTSTEVAKDLLLTITVKREFKFWFRFWLMTRFLKLAAFAAPIAVKIENE